MAYQNFIQDLATALTNDTSTIEQDVKDIFEFEKNISMVSLHLLISNFTLFFPI